MSEGLSLGVKHQMLVDEYSPKAADTDQALDDITETLSTDELDLSEGNETLVMLAAHSPEAIPTDLELETLLNRVKDAVLSYMSGHKGETKIEIDQPPEPLTDIGLEDYKDTLRAIRDRVIKALRWLGRQVVATYKRLSDRLGRLSLRVMYIERKIDSSSDTAIPTDVVVLPPSAAMLSLYAKPPQNASEVMNAVAKVKWLFTTIHNDYGLFQQTFKRAVDAGDRADALEIIQGFLSHLSNRLNTRVDSQRNGRQVFNQLPSNFIVEISSGASFTDCWATINRTTIVNVGGAESRRPDRASLSRLINELKNFLKVINELYGKVGSRLTTDFRNITRDAERSLSGDNVDTRTVEASINWFTEQQNRLFYRSMVLGCSAIAAALDYCEVSLRKNVGNEGFEEEESGMQPITQSLSELRGAFAERERALSVASVSIATVAASLEAFSEEVEGFADHQVGKLMTTELLPLQMPWETLTYNHWVLAPATMNEDYSPTLLKLLRNANRELDTFCERDEVFKTLLMVHPNKQVASDEILKRYGYHGGTNYVQYLFNDNAIPTSCAGVLEGPAVSADKLIALLSTFRKRTCVVGASLSNSDVLVSELYRALSPETGIDVQADGFTAGWGVQTAVKRSDYGPVSVFISSLNNRDVYSGDFPAIDSEGRVKAQEIIIKLVEMDGDLSAQWSDLNQIVTRARSVQNIIADALAVSNQHKVDDCLMDGIKYMQMLLVEVRWQTRLLRDIIMYRYALMMSLCQYQATGVTDVSSS